MKTPGCIYCAVGLGITSDHIPPTCFFSTKPSHPITVPCCEECRVKDQSHDEFIRSLFTSFDLTEAHPAVTGELGKSRERSYGYRPDKLFRLVEITVPTKYGPAFNLKDDVRVDRFLERVARGVLYDASLQPYFEAVCRWRLVPEFASLFESEVSPEVSRKDINGVFSYISDSANEDGVFYVTLRFYANLFVAVELSPRLKREKA